MDRPHHRLDRGCTHRRAFQIAQRRSGRPARAARGGRHTRGRGRRGHAQAAGRKQASRRSVAGAADQPFSAAGTYNRAAPAHDGRSAGAVRPDREPLPAQPSRLEPARGEGWAGRLRLRRGTAARLQQAGKAQTLDIRQSGRRPNRGAAGGRRVFRRALRGSRNRRPLRFRPRWRIRSCDRGSLDRLRRGSPSSHERLKKPSSVLDSKVGLDYLWAPPIKAVLRPIFSWCKKFMRILILGGDGYLGWPTAMHFSARGHDVMVADNMIKRYWEAEVGVEPLIPVPTLYARVKRWKEVSGHEIKLHVADIARNNRVLYEMLDRFRPEAVVHYAEQPSAPFSMIDREKCVQTQVNNVAGTLNLLFGLRHACPDAHIVKLGTMGEYGTPNIDIEEGWLDVTHNGRKDRVLYPKKPGSFYHLSKVHDSHNLKFPSPLWA